MFCPKCGNQTDEYGVCPTCGNQIVNNQSPNNQSNYYQQPGYNQQMYQQPGYNQQMYQQPGYNQPMYQQPGYQPPFNNQYAYNMQNNAVFDNVAGAIKKGCGSTIAFVFAILSTVVFIFSIINLASGQGAINISSATVNGNSNMAVYIVVMIIGLIPQFLLCLGLWMAVISGFSSSGRMGTGGFTNIMVSAIIYIVYCSLGIMLFLLVMLMSFSDSFVYSMRYSMISYYAFSSSDIRLILIIGSFIFVVAFIISITMQASVIRLTSALKRGVRGLGLHKVTLYLPVLMIIVGVLSLIPMVNYFANGRTFAGVSSLLNVITYIVGAIAILLLRSKVHKTIGR